MDLRDGKVDGFKDLTERNEHCRKGFYRIMKKRGIELTEQQLAVANTFFVMGYCWRMTKDDPELRDIAILVGEMIDSYQDRN